MPRKRVEKYRADKKDVDYHTVLAEVRKEKGLPERTAA